MDSKQNSGELLSIRDAAKLAGVDYETIARWIRREKLPARKVQVHGLREEWRIRHEDLRRITGKI